MMKKLISMLLLLGLLFTNVIQATAAAPAAKAKKSKPAISMMSHEPRQRVFKLDKNSRYKSGEIIVKFKDNIKPAAIDSKLNKLNTKIKKALRGRAYIVPIAKGKSMEAFINQLLQDSDVLYAEPNYICKAAYVPNDPYYGLQWHLPKINAPQAWDITKGSQTVTVAVVDTGVDINHPELKSHIVKPYNTVNNNTDVTDYEGHGTHVAGIIAATINNGIGVSGVAPNVSIMPVAVFSGESAFTSDVAEGVRYATDNGARVINLSLGSYQYSYLLEDAINYAYDKGAVVVAAAGNDSISLPSYPAAYRNVISVSATDQYDTKAYFSNYGSTIDVAAPGVNIYSTLPSGEFGYASGTSMASPVAAGVAALVLSKNSSLKNYQVRSILFNSAQDLGSSGIDDYYGYGRVDAYKAINTTASGLDQWENNNTFNSAKSVALVSSLQATLNPKEDIDIYKFTVDHSQQVKIKIVPSAKQDVVLNIYRTEDLSLVASIDDNYIGEAEEFVQTMSSGDYYVAVYEYDGIPDSTPYTLSVQGEVPPPTISQLMITPNPFTVTGISTLSIRFNLSHDSTVNVTIKDSANNIVKRLASSKSMSAGTNTLTWDGKNDSGCYVVGGEYSVLVEASGIGGTAVPQNAAFIVVDKIAPIIDQISAPGYFSPKGTNVWKLSYRLSEPSKVSITIYNSAGNTIKTLISNVVQQAGTQSVSWDGKNAAGLLVSDGTYTYKINYSDTADNSGTIKQGNVIVDTKAPSISNVSDSPDPFLADGSKTATISFKLSEKAKVSIKVYSENGTLFTELLKDKECPAGDNKVLWNGQDSAGKWGIDGYYKYTISAVDYAGNSSAAQNGQIRVDASVPKITNISDTPDPIAPTGSNYNSIYFSLSEKSKVTLKIYDKYGTVKKTLLNNVVLTAGNHATKWDMRDSRNIIVGDGVYTYKIEAVDDFGKRSSIGQGTITLDRVKPVLKLISPSTITFNYYGGNSINITFNLSETAKTTLRVMKSDGTTVKYILNNTQKPNGNITVAWDGKDSSGNTVVSGTYKFELSALDYAGNKSSVIQGSIVLKDLCKPSVNIGETLYFSPANSSNISVSYSLSEKSYVTIGIYNSSGTLIKTIESNVLKNNSSNSFIWDGKNANNTIAPNGTYIYRITAKDMSGNYSDAVSGKIVVDTVAPVISNVSVTDNYSNIAFKFKVSEASQVTIVIYDYFSFVPEVIYDKYVSAGEYTVNWNYSGYGIYYYSILARDKAGNLGKIVSGEIW